MDTSVWIDHFRHGNSELAGLLNEGGVLCHPFVLGELACVGLKNRNEILELLQALPEAPMAEHEEVLELVCKHELSGKILGWIDAHLLASALLNHCPLWTLDETLAATVSQLNLN